MNASLLSITHALNGLLMVALGIGAGVWITRKARLNWNLYWIGAAGFVLSQIGHIPFNIILTVLFRRGVLPAPPVAWRLPFNAVVLGLSAGLFEELTRYAVYRWWAKDARSWYRGLLLGAGHGGAEAVILGLLVLANYVTLAALRGSDLTARVPAEQLALAQQQIQAYWSISWYDSLLGALERLFTLPVQIGLSVLVLQVFTRRQTGWLWLAIGWHALVDAAAVYGLQTWGIYPTEALVGLAAVLSIGIIFLLRRPEPEPEPVIVKAERPLPVFELPPVDETAENIEATKYTG